MNRCIDQFPEQNRLCILYRMITLQKGGVIANLPEVAVASLCCEILLWFRLCLFLIFLPIAISEKDTPVYCWIIRSWELFDPSMENT